MGFWLENGDDFTPYYRLCSERIDLSLFLSFWAKLGLDSVHIFGLYIWSGGSITIENLHALGLIRMRTFEAQKIAIRSIEMSVFKS